MTRPASGPHEGAPTVLSTRPAVAVDRSKTFRLRVTQGADAGLESQVTAADPGRVLAGQSAACTLRLHDREVSRRHAAFDVRGARLHVADLDSTNGTYVNGVEIREAVLHGGETLRLGATVIAVEQGEDNSLALPRALSFGRIVGGSAAMRRLYPLCQRLAQADIPLLIEGETGTGKEMLAESIHEESRRTAGPFVVFDCTAIPPNLAESMLFGHEKGAFTGAIAARRGVFEQAHGGTLFIDEVGDLDAQLQPKLLRAIERAEVQRVGSERWLKVDVRVISATRRNLDLEVQEGRFRDDLFFRLAVARIELPPLRDRAEDRGLLARHFWRRLGGEGELPLDLVRRHEDYSFPGNVRELHNLVARRIALGELDPDVGASSSPSSAASSLRAPGASPNARPWTDLVDEVLAKELPLAPSRQILVQDFERRYTEHVLARYQGDSALAAESSGIARRYFQLIRARR